jgi:hypothetical protein
LTGHAELISDGRVWGPAPHHGLREANRVKRGFTHGVAGAGDGAGLGTELTIYLPDRFRPHAANSTDAPIILARM